MSEALKRAKQRYYNRNKESICLQAQVNYWENAAGRREKKRTAAKAHYYQSQIALLEKALAADK